MNGAGAHTWMDVFMPQIVKRLVNTVDGMTQDRVFRSNWDDKWHLSHPIADRFITLFTPSFMADQRAVDGGGVYNTPFDMRLTTTLFVRLEADLEGKSIKLLEDEVNGIDKLIHKVVKCLHMWDGPLVNEEGSPQLHAFRRPMRVLPGFEIQKRAGAGDTRWSVTPVSWEVSFVADLSEPYPGNES